MQRTSSLLACMAAMLTALLSQLSAHAQVTITPSSPLKLSCGDVQPSYGTRPATVTLSLSAPFTNCIVYQESTDMVHWSSVFTNTWSAGMRVYVKTNEAHFYRVICPK